MYNIVVDMGESSKLGTYRFRVFLNFFWELNKFIIISKIAERSRYYRKPVANCQNRFLDNNSI